MKVVILAGGFGTRISEESVYKPKPLIDIGGQPIIWHIMKYYSSYGYNDFIICGGYKQNCLKEYFANYFINNSDITFNFSNNSMEVHHSNIEPWSVTIVDTGLNTMTGGRVKYIEDYLDDGPFMLTYGDGVSDVNLNDLLQFHKNSKKLVTLTAVMPGGRFGSLGIDDDGVINSFKEKRKEDGGWINGGFMILEKRAIDYIEDYDQMLENEPFNALVRDGELTAFKHHGFWQCMDSMKDRMLLESLIENNQAPWIKW